MIKKLIRRLLGRVAEWMIRQENKQVDSYTLSNGRKNLLERELPRHSPGIQLPPESCQRGEHDWRFIASPYVRQCKVKSCGHVMFVGEIPDGLKEYVDKMTGPNPGFINDGTLRQGDRVDLD